MEYQVKCSRLVGLVIKQWVFLSISLWILIAPVWSIEPLQNIATGFYSLLYSFPIPYCIKSQSKDFLLSNAYRSMFLLLVIPGLPLLQNPRRFQSRTPLSSNNLFPSNIFSENLNISKSSSQNNFQSKYFWWIPSSVIPFGFKNKKYFRSNRLLVHWPLSNLMRLPSLRLITYHCQVDTYE